MIIVIYTVYIYIIIILYYCIIIYIDNNYNIYIYILYGSKLIPENRQLKSCGLFIIFLVGSRFFCGETIF